MTSRLTRFSGVLATLLVLLGPVLLGHVTAASEPESLTPVVVELFTSQGCSSCPPADELLMTLERNQPVAGVLIIPLSEHVDYWNRLGWLDPFSSELFAARQRSYAKALGARSLYTPQMVVDGQAEFVGSQPVTARVEILRASRAPKARIVLTATVAPGSRILTVRANIDAVPDPTSGDRTDVWFAVTEGGLITDVERGENASRRLHHTGVVRHLERLSASLPRPTPARHHKQVRVKLDPEWRHGYLRAIVVLQERTSHRIVGAAQTAVR